MPHFYLKNVQGDVVGVTDAAGNIEERYAYDAWGKLVSITDENGTDRTTDTDFIGYINPIRYRGYYYDSETGLYYLNARYYDPVTGRFINADSTLSGGFNLFAYCYNNPIILIDWSGSIPTPLEAAYMAEHIYNSETIFNVGGWKYEQSLFGGDSMVLGIYYRTVNNVTEYALVSKGTSPSNWKDWKNNVEQFTSGSSTDGWASLDKARNFISNHPNAEVTFVGHSKGGAEATINAVATNRNCIIFNPSIPNLGSYGLDVNNYTARLRSYVVQGEVLRKYLFGNMPVGKTFYLCPPSWSGSLERHSMKSVIAGLRKGVICSHF